VDPVTGLPRVGMVGGGQLARMTQQAAIALGQSLRVLAIYSSEPAALVTPNVTLGHHTDLDALRSFARTCDVLTFDHEHVPQEHLRALVAEGVKVHPGPDALIHAQDKLVMRDRLAAMDVPVPAYAEVTSPSDLVSFGQKYGWPCVLKATRGGYDGRGVWMVTEAEAVPLATELLAAETPLLVEERVAMKRELAAVVARSPFGQGAAWPAVETVQKDGICVEVLAPAPSLSAALASEA
jgi:5-(carboxyamino)imidazole ribonucleotide synthase